MINRIPKNPRLGTVQIQKLTADKFNELMDYQKPITLLDEPIVKWNMRKSYNAKVTIADNRTLRIEQLTPGDYGTLEIIQGSGGNKTLTLPTEYNNKVANDGGGLLTLSTVEQQIDVATFYYNGSYLLWTLSTNFTS
jgi:hypothetical protein